MLEYIILGVVQGLTEFFPVSSSAHLAILQRLFGLSAEGLVISIILHLGTLLSLTVFFFKDILALFRDKRTLLLVILVTIITGIIGVSGKDFFESLFSSYKLIGLGLFITGVLLLTTKMIKGLGKDVLSKTDAVILGLVQGIAIIPGISRSGSTVSALLFRKINKETAFRFSFLVSLPAVLGATLLEARHVDMALQVHLVPLLVGFLFSFFTGLFALSVLKSVINKAKLYYFGYYCIIISVLTIIFIK